MPLFGPKLRCPHCGSNVRKPADPAYYLCPRCDKPGPWASDEQVTTWTAWKEQQEREEAERSALELRRRQEELEAARSLKPIHVDGFIAQKSEQVYFSMEANLAKWVKERGRYMSQGASLRGISVRVPGVKGARAYFGGASPKRTYVPGEEGWKVVDQGTAIVTSKRIVFRGSVKGIEWAYSKLIGLGADPSSKANRSRSRTDRRLT